MTDTEIDPELVDDRDTKDEDVEPVTLPEYDGEQFALPDDFEWVDNDGLEEGDE